MRVWFLAVGAVAAFTAQAFAADDARFFKSLEKLAPTDRLEESWLERVKATAAQISSALGYRA